MAEQRLSGRVSVPQEANPTLVVAVLAAISGSFLPFLGCLGTRTGISLILGPFEAVCCGLQEQNRAAALVLLLTIRSSLANLAECLVQSDTHSERNDRKMNGLSSQASTVAKEAPRRRVLVVDDSRDARAILRMLLTKLGHEAREAEDAESGMALSREFQPEVVLCDIMLSGGMSGYAFAKAARQDVALRELCIVAVSGWEGSDHERQAFEAGFDRVLRKPVELADLAKILQTLPRRFPKPSEI